MNIMKINQLPPNLGQLSLSISLFKCGILKYYENLVEEVEDDIDILQTFKTVCVKCLSCPPLSSLSVKFSLTSCLALIKLSKAAFSRLCFKVIISKLDQINNTHYIFQINTKIKKTRCARNNIKIRATLVRNYL